MSATIVAVYVILIFACTLAFASAGMTFFDALCHALPAISTGGFSTKDSSLGFWRSGAIEWIAILFMVLGSLPFLAYLHVLRGTPMRFARDRQIITFLGIVIAASRAPRRPSGEPRHRDGRGGSAQRGLQRRDPDLDDGFVANDYTNWGAFSDALLFLVMFLGGCTGSTAGGIKTFRLMILWQALKTNLMRTVYPSSVTLVRYDGRTIGDDVVLSVFQFVGVYLLTFALIGLALTALGHDPMTAYSGTLAALSNVGPGLGPVVGPAGNFAGMGDAALWLLSFAMLIGRLELFTVLVLLAPRFWRG